ncbi:helix-turn-helix domain-containing protein [Solibacillus sp. FSL H8-0523]|uniref:helix-turn-helix domain-containing protein n=1 Tax=Solibacillus sp. FSL H8-0523 TaxID=2954511 RepID=UPI0031016F06
MSNKTFSIDTKISALKYLEEGRYSVREICRMFNVNVRNLYEWQAKYQFGGINALLCPAKNKIYPEELKRNAIEDYLTGNYSKHELMVKYGISGQTVFNRWLKKYNSHSELKDSNQRMTQTMTKGRKTTLEERIEIVKTCLKNEKDYKKHNGFG